MDSIFKKLSKNSDLLMALVVVGILIVLIIPMPTIVIDLLLSLNIALSIMLLLTAIYTKRTLDLSVFPSLLLITTLFRLSVNVATTRSILLNGGTDGTAAGGSIIEAFGQFVVGGNYVVGLIIFIILVIINFVVITKGAGRIAEVAARFTLDAMPGKQMAIDADLNAGVINEEAARKRRQDVSQEADFYGAMDGASKFVRGDAIAGILICIVNVIGGILIGSLQYNMSLMAAIETFTILTIGDGLVSQLPAFIISTAAGMIVTRTGTESNLGEEVTQQLFSNPKSIMAAALVMFILGTFQGLPTVPFFTLAILLAGLAYYIIKKQNADIIQKEEEFQREKLKPTPDNLENLLSVDMLELEVGYGLVNLVDPEQNGDLLERITNIRKQFAMDLGIIIPTLRLRDNLELKPGDYQILLKGVCIASGSLMVGHLLAMDPGSSVEKIPGIPTKEPAFGLDALWISADQKEKATFLGYTVVDLSTVIVTHLTEILRQYSFELLGRQELQSLLDGIKQSAPKAVEDVIPNILSLGVLLKVLKNLLKEGVSIRDLKTILETLAEHGIQQKDPAILTEHVRASLARSITKSLIGGGNELGILTLDKEIEETIASGIIQTDQGQQLSIEPDFVRTFIGDLNEKVMLQLEDSNQAVILCSPVIRSHLKTLVERFIPNVIVLSHNEITPNIKIKSVGTVRLVHAS